MKTLKTQVLGLILLSMIVLAGNVAVAQYNTAYGTGALGSVTSGIFDSAFGYQALYTDNVGDYNTATGADALFENTSGNYNTASGEAALLNNTTGAYNTASGAVAMSANVTGSYNTATGMSAMAHGSSASNNTADGYEALYYSASCCNAAVGASALYYVTTGQANTGVGNSAGKTADTSNITGKNNTFLGTGTTLGTGTLNNASALGANAQVDASNSLVLGSINGVNGQTVTVKVGIGTTTPDNNLTVNGSADKPGGGSWGTYSDGRLKTLDGHFNSGLEQILKINPVRYRYRPDNAMGIQDAEEHVGLVAQEVQKVIPEAVTENSRGYLLLNNDPIIWAMLNAIKQQQTLIEKQRQEIQTQQTQITQILSQVKLMRSSLRVDSQTRIGIRRVKNRAPVAR